MKTITLSEFKELVGHEDWEHFQELILLEDCERTEQYYREEMGEECIEYSDIKGGHGTVRIISVLGDVTITYDEHFEYDDYEPRSLKIHEAGDYEWNSEGLVVVADEGSEGEDELDIADLIEYLHLGFSEVDYSFLDSKLRHVTVVDGVDDDGHMFTVRVSNAPDIRFAGTKIAEVSSSVHRDSESYSGKTGFWNELILYKTKDDKYICQQIERTEWANADDHFSARVCTTLEDVERFFGADWLAKRLYSMAQIDSAILAD